MIAIAASPLSCQTAGVGADDDRAGFLVGSVLGATPRNRSVCANSTLIVMADSAAGTVNTQRVAGILAGFDSQCPGTAAGARIIEAGTQDGAYDAFTAAITGLPAEADILVASVDDTAAQGVVAAIPQTRSARVTVAAIGADAHARCQMGVDPRWIGDAALFPDRYGDVVVPALLDALSGRQIPRSLFVRTTFLTAATISDFYDPGECPVR
jgi:hypothetical protein